MIFIRIAEVEEDEKGGFVSSLGIQSLAKRSAALAPIPRYV